MGFGFVVARFGLFLQQLQVTQHSPSAQSYGLSLWFGTALIAVGVIMFLLSAWHHLRLVRELNRGGPLPSRPSTQAVLIALFLALVGLAMAIYLVSVRGSAHPDLENNKEAVTKPILSHASW
jgi:putative membrane protein